LARIEGLEPSTLDLESTMLPLTPYPHYYLVRVEGLEPSPHRPKRCMLPLNTTL
tara:strand:- start:1665 stop:1826 length:162 start_codon:yes stop_codon:yes gene_type:complete